MSRMFDRLKVSGFRPCIPMPPDMLKSAYHTSRLWVAELHKANPVIVLIDNVADYYWQGTPETWDIDDFPSLAPPWPLTFLEYRAPTRIVDHSGITPFNKQGLGQHFGILLDSLEPGTEPTFRGLPEFAILPGHQKKLTPEPAEGMKWVQEASIFAEVQGDILLLGSFRWSINGNGVLSDGWEKVGGLPFLAPFSPKLSEKEIAELAHPCWCFLSPGLLAISFMHCRNTVIVDVAPDSKLEKANRKRGKPPSVRYKILEIEPVKRILSTHGSAETAGLKQALHICRGHFKDYREHGLFGKRKGLYWWDMHVRGTVKKGVVVKDYEMPKLTQ